MNHIVEIIALQDTEKAVLVQMCGMFPVDTDVTYM